MCPEEAGECQRRRGLRAVDERQAFLGSEHDRLQTGFRKGCRARQALASEEGFGFAHHNGCHMGKWREVAGGSDGALFRDNRDHAFFQHAFDQPHQLQPHARRTAAERDQLQGHDQANNIFGKRRADAAAVRKDQIALQGCYVGRVDLDRGEFSEAGIDAVDGRIASRDLGDAGSGLGDAGIEGWIELRRRAGPVDRLQILERNGAGMKGNGQRSILSPLKTCA